MTYQTVTFKNKKYNIDDDKTAKNLTQIQEREIEKLNILVNDYKHLLEVSEKAHKECIRYSKRLEQEIKEYQNELKESDERLSLSIDEKKIIEKEKDKIKNSIEMFFRLNENIIKEF